MSHSCLYAAARTPFGRFNGALAQVRPNDLAAAAIRGVLTKVPGLDPAAIDDAFWGNANGAGEDNRNVGRMAVLLAGLPVTVPANTVNRLCGSSLDAAMIASRTVESGDADVVLAGGVESKTRAPGVLSKPSRGFPAGDVTAVSTTLGWRLVNPTMPAQWTVSLGECNEQRYDRFYDDLVVGVPGVELARDEGIRPDTTVETLATLRPAFRPDGVITAGNASPLNDGAAAVIIGSERADTGTDPPARIAGRAAAALEPQRFGYAPVRAAELALERAGIGWADVGAVEFNEAFAIAIGHPLGASGGRILGTLAHVLRERRERWGVAAICIGVGQGLAMVLENLGAVR